MQVWSMHACVSSAMHHRRTPPHASMLGRCHAYPCLRPSPCMRLRLCSNISAGASRLDTASCLCYRQCMVMSRCFQNSQRYHMSLMPGLPPLPFAFSATSHALTLAYVSIGMRGCRSEEALSCYFFVNENCAKLFTSETDQVVLVSHTNTTTQPVKLCLHAQLCLHALCT